MFVCVFHVRGCQGTHLFSYEKVSLCYFAEDVP